MDYEVIRIPGFGNPFVTIKTEDITEEVTSLTDYLDGNKTESITGYIGNEAYPVKTESTRRIYAENGKVLAEGNDVTYTLRSRLYEIEDKLSRQLFIRISNSEIINRNMIRKFDLSLTGIITIVMDDGSRSKVARRAIPGIRKKLGI